MGLVFSAQIRDLGMVRPRRHTVAFVGNILAGDGGQGAAFALRRCARKGPLTGEALSIISLEIEIR